MTRRSLTAAALVTGLFLVTGCGGAAEKASERTAEERIEDAAEAQGEDVDVDIDDDEVTIETSDGAVVMGGGKLPEGFPTDDIPVVDGEVLVGMGAAGEGWQVTMKVDDPEQAFAEAVSLLEGAGFTRDDDAAMAGAMTATLSAPGYEVVILGGGAAGAGTLGYVVEID